MRRQCLGRISTQEVDPRRLVIALGVLLKRTKARKNSNNLLGQFAIRPTVTSNNKFSRDSIIKTVASVVGREHSVDLKNYDLLIIVLVIQVSLPRLRSRGIFADGVLKNVIGMSVVGSDYDDLKRYNLAELYRPAPKASAAPASE